MKTANDYVVSLRRIGLLGVNFKNPAEICRSAVAFDSNITDGFKRDRIAACAGMTKIIIPR